MATFTRPRPAPPTIEALGRQAVSPRTRTGPRTAGPQESSSAIRDRLGEGVAAGQEGLAPPGRSRFGEATSTRLGYLGLRAMHVFTFLACVVMVIRLVVPAGGGGHSAGAGAAGPSEVGPSNFATLFVEKFLPAGEGTESTLAQFFSPGTHVALTDVRPGSYAAASALAVAIKEVCGAPTVHCGYWAATVAVDVLGTPSPAVIPALSILTGPSTTVAIQPPTIPLGQRCYLVGVQTHSGRFVTDAVPSPTACPAPPKATPPVFGVPEVTVGGEPISDATNQFLTAMLTGQPIDRYLAPGAAVQAITPAPFTSITMTGLSKTAVTRANGVLQVRVRVGVEAKDDAGRVQQLSFFLRLVKPLNQWVVAQQYGAPPLASN